MDVDRLVSDLLGHVSDPTTEEPSDAVSAIFENGRLESFGINVTKLQKETAVLDARAIQIYKRERKLPAPAGFSKATDDWEELLSDDSRRLAKRYVAGIHTGKKAARVEKSANGLWTHEFDEHGELIRGYVNDDAA